MSLLNNFDQLVDGTTIFYGTRNGKEVVIDGEHIPYKNSVFCPNGKTVMEIKEYLAKKHGIEDVNGIGLRLEWVYPIYNDDGTIKNADGSLDITNAKGGVELRSCAQDFLELENQFLQDELEFQEIENSLELIQTIKDCIRKEGGVSSSLEIMFGENWSDKSVALEELEKAEEGLLDIFKNKINTDANKEAVVQRMIKSILEKIEKIKKEDLNNVKYPFEVPSWMGGNRVSALADAYQQLSFMSSNSYNDDSDKFQERLNELLESVKLAKNSQNSNIISSDADILRELDHANNVIKTRETVHTHYKLIPWMKNHVKEITTIDDKTHKLYCRVLDAADRCLIYSVFKIINIIYSHVFGNKNSKN